jgi:hypothetical protein
MNLISCPQESFQPNGMRKQHIESAGIWSIHNSYYFCSLVNWKQMNNICEKILLRFWCNHWRAT